jgi:mRNA interferase MazF
MRPIHLARIDKTRPVLVLTRERARGAMTSVTIAPIASTVKGLATEVRVGRANGLDHECAVACDNIRTIRSSSLGRVIGFLHEEQEPALAAAIVSAFDLRAEDLEER